MIAPARVAAYDILLAISSGRSDLPAAIAHARGGLRDERDRALAAEIATGVQRWRARLDHLIAHFAKRPVPRLDVEVVEILRLSIYQLLHLTRVPAAAVVDDAVNLAKRVGKTSARGLVNAVLRSVSRQRDALPLPPRPDDGSNRDAVLDYLSVTLSHPRWLATRWLDRLGFTSAESWMNFNNLAAPLTLRANRARTNPVELRTTLAARGIDVEPGRYAPDALVVRTGHPLRDPSVAKGLFVVQDEASQLVALLAGRTPASPVLDACASPGGKATAMAASMSADGLLVACDVRDRRVALLKQTVAATEVSQIRVVQADLLSPLPFGPVFRCVVVDAPCSGLGTLRRDPDIRWRRSEADLARLADAQREMLAHAQAVVAPGGRLVYATCSSEPEENEAIVDAFLAEFAMFTRVDARQANDQLSADLVDARGHFRTCPDRHGLEVFFAAVFERSQQL